MDYSEEFKQRVLSVFGNDKDIKKMLDSGSAWLGRYLNDVCMDRFSAEEIIESFELKNLKTLYQEAKRQIAIKELYSEWLTLYREQYHELKR